MINEYYLGEIEKRLGAIFTYGLENKYSPFAIEERVASSSFANQLEKGIYDYLSSYEDIASNVYETKIEKCDISFRSLFLAKCYTYLFFKTEKSFEYLFLYLPLKELNEKYDVYHEMDLSSLLIDFNKKREETPLFKILCVRKGYKYTDISSLTGINMNTIERYSRKDEYLCNASFKNIHLLSSFFGVKDNIFLSSLMCFEKSKDRKRDAYMSFLGFYLLSYYDKRIDTSSYQYNEKDDCFESHPNPSIIKVMVEPSDLDGLYDKNIYLVIFPSKGKDYPYLEDKGFYEVMIIEEDNVTFLYKNKKKELTNSIRNQLIKRTKETERNFEYE